MSQENDIKNISKFVKTLENILTKYQSSEQLDKKSQIHQKNLEKLLLTSNKLLKKTATEAEISGFDELLDLTDLSYRSLKQSNKSDKEFKEQYSKAFGDFNKNASFTNKLAFDASTKLDSIKESIKDTYGAIKGQALEDVGDTLGDFLGPLGKIRQEFIDVDTVKSAYGSFKERIGGSVGAGGGVKGQFHDGMDMVPEEGSYMLDGGERVISAEQNKDLGSVMSNIKSKGNVMDVYVKGHDSKYFNDIIESDHKQSREEWSLMKRQHRDVEEKFEILNDVISRANVNWLAGMAIQMDLAAKRFDRHPILNSIGILASATTKIVTSFSSMFGVTSLLKKFFVGDKAKNNTDRIVYAIEDMTDELSGRGVKDRRSVIGRGMDTAILGLRSGIAEKAGGADKWWNTDIGGSDKRFESFSGGKSAGADPFSRAKLDVLHSINESSISSFQLLQFMQIDLAWIREHWGGGKSDASFLGGIGGGIGGKKGMWAKAKGLAKKGGVMAVSMATGLYGILKPLIIGGMQFAFKGLATLVQMPFARLLGGAGVAFGIGSLIGDQIYDNLSKETVDVIGGTIYQGLKNVNKFTGGMLEKFGIFEPTNENDSATKKSKMDTERYAWQISKQNALKGAQTTEQFRAIEKQYSKDWEIKQMNKTAPKSDGTLQKLVEETVKSSKEIVKAITEQNNTPVVLPQESSNNRSLKNSSLSEAL